MQTPHAAVTLSYWSQAGRDRNDPRLSKPGAVPLTLGPDGRFHRGTLQVPAAGLLRIRYAAPRPLRMWIGGVMAVDECLNWRHFSRRVHGAVLLPVAAGATDLLVEVGERPRHPEHVDRIEVRTDLPFTLTLIRNGEEKTLDCPAGHSLQ
jgi:hypothetical protein